MLPPLKLLDLKILCEHDVLCDGACPLLKHLPLSHDVVKFVALIQLCSLLPGPRAALACQDANVHRGMANAYSRGLMMNESAAASKTFFFASHLVSSH
jgi:hypothetical protein